MRSVTLFLFAVVGSLSCACPHIGYCQTVPESHKQVVTSETIPLTKTGLRIYKPDKAFDGYTLFNHLSNAAPTEAWVKYTNMYPPTPIYLIDMKGDIVWQWSADTSVSFARLAPNGHLFYITNDFPKEGVYEPGLSGMRELDKDSNVLWFYPAFIQHDFRLLEDGNILFERYENVEKNPKKPAVLVQRIEIYSPKEKKVVWSWRTEDHVQEMENLTGVKIDTTKTSKFENWAHNNSCELLADSPLGRADPRFKKGNIYISFPHTDIMGIIEYPSGKVVWAWGPGVLDAQHQPMTLPNGNILLFDNGRKRSWSRVIEVNPATKKIVWEYHSVPREAFFSMFLSGAERLPNGNILVCDGLNCRLFEITHQGEIVWDFVGTYDRVNYRHGIIRANRYSPEYVKPLLEAIKQ